MEINKSEDLGSLIRKKRKEDGLTLHDAAAICGVSHVFLFWLSVNRTFGSFVINHHERRKVHAKETSQLHPGREGFYFTSSSGRACTCIKICVTSISFSRRFSISGRSSFSRTERQPLPEKTSLKSVLRK
jgi:hypothetical protein